MHALLAVLLLASIFAPADAEFQRAGQIELAKRTATDHRFQRSRTLAQAVHHYRVAVMDAHFADKSKELTFDRLIDEGFLLAWAGDHGFPVTLRSTSEVGQGFRLMRDGDLPEFSYESWGLEHPVGKGAWEETTKWIPTNVEGVVETITKRPPKVLGRRKGIELQMLAPIQLCYQFSRTMPVSYAAACRRSHVSPLDTAVDNVALEGLTIYLLPGTNRYAIQWTGADGKTSSDVYGFAPDKMEPQRVGSEITPEMVQAWPIPAGAEEPEWINTQLLRQQMATVLPKLDEETMPYMEP